MQAAFLYQVPAAKFNQIQVEVPFNLAGELAKDRPAVQRRYKDTWPQDTQILPSWCLNSVSQHP